MSSPKVRVQDFHYHCNYDTPFFCNYGHKGLEMHCHLDFYEFCIIVSGSYEHIYNNKKDTCKTGTLMFFSPGETHSLIEASPNSYHYSFIVKREFFENFCKQHQHNSAEILSTPSCIKKTTGVLFTYICQLASHLTYTANQSLLPLVNSFLFNILFACFDTMPIATADMNKIYAVDLSQLFNSYMGLDEDISNLCKNFPISRTALIQDFKDLTGYTIVQYRNIKRMEYAAHLLLEANYSISDICNMLNIENPSHFSKQFKKKYGVTPKQYQLQHRSTQSEEQKNL